MGLHSMKNPYKLKPECIPKDVSIFFLLCFGGFLGVNKPKHRCHQIVKRIDVRDMNLSILSKVNNVLIRCRDRVNSDTR